ncbi:nucleotidyltransferase family protein [Candidatus Peregrinibacteria bacterium]|nr:nucleotidyltransferase family protein [Candidatus Peregrinibacteria bacterium]
MKAVILAAGNGKRMRPFTLSKPKALLVIGDKTILEYIFDAFTPEIDDVYIVIRYLGNQIRNFVEKKFPDKKIHFVEGSDKGSAYSLLAVKPFIDLEESFMIINGDDLPTKQEVQNCLKYKNCILVCQSDQPESCGIIEFNKNGTIKHILEKPFQPLSKMAVGGIIVVSGKILDYHPKPSLVNGEFFVTSLLNQYIKDIDVYPVYTGACRQFSSPEDIKGIEDIIKQRL